MRLSFPLFPGISARDALSRSTDGPILAKQWAEADEYDRAHPLQPSHALTRIGKVTIKRDYGVKLLSWAMAQAIAARGCVMDADLAKLGLSEKQVKDWKAEALALVLAAEPALNEFNYQEAA